MRLNKTHLVLFFLLVAGCTVSMDVEPSVTAELGTEFQLGMGQSGVIVSENLSVTFLNILEDSRCPIGVECIWAGRVTANLSITQNTLFIGDFNFTLNADESESVRTINGYSIKVAEVVPEKVAEHEIRPEDYLITIIITKE